MAAAWGIVELGNRENGELFLGEGERCGMEQDNHVTGTRSNTRQNPHYIHDDFTIPSKRKATF